MGSSVKDSKSQAARHKRRPSANAASAKGSPRKSGHKTRPTLRELAKEFAKERGAADDRVLTPFQRRMMSGGA